MSASNSERLKKLSPEKLRLLLQKMREEGARAGQSSIPRRSGQAPAPLSYAQQRLWFLQQLEPDSPAYNIHLSLRLRGRLNVAVLERTLSEIVRRHESLRTTFVAVEGVPAQVVSAAEPLTLPVINLSDAAEPETEAVRLSAEQAARPFDLARGPLLRVVLLKLADEDHVILLTMHHIISDKWSIGVLVNEVTSLYQSLDKGQDSPLPELPVQYADYAVWQREWMQGERLESQLSYWKKQLENVPGILELPADRPRSATASYSGATQAFALPKGLSDGLEKLARGQKATLYTTLLAAFQTLLSRYSGQTDISVGSPIAGRSRLETEGLIGFFVNTLVMRTDLAGDPTFAELLGRAREVTLGAYAHQDVPFEKLVEELQPERSLSHTPLFQAMLVLQNTPRGTLELGGLRLEAFGGAESGTAKFDLTLTLIEGGNGLSGFIEYNRDLFEASTVERLLGHLRRLLEAVVADPHRRLSELPLLSETEERQLLVGWNDTARNYPSMMCVHQLFEQQVGRAPDAVALACEDEQLSYRELNDRANRVAHYLRELGVGPESLVGVCLERGPGMVVGLLGVLKAGGAYVPLEPTYPRERLSFILEDARVEVVLTVRALLTRFPEEGLKTVCLDEDWDEISAEIDENPEVEVYADNLAYITYTSGSTGRPKGVSVTHRGVVRLVKACNYARLDGDQVFLQFAPLAFDASTFEIWGSLLNGARLAVMPTGLLTLQQLGKALRRHGVTVLWLTAGLFHLMVDEWLEDLSGLRQMLAGGDVLSVPHVRRFLENVPGCTLVNGYGPTENTTFTCCHVMDAPSEFAHTVPIGRPITNTQVYLLDRDLRPVVVGAVGELYTAGDGLARGYLNRAGQTAERFVPHPFSQRPGARLYRTGDLARYLPDGEIEFLGRADHQVKIRGFRIELGEIEAALAHHPAVREAALLVRADDAGDKRLVAYLAAAAGADAPSAAALRQFLKERLPEYMVPSAFVTLDQLPLTQNGKVDRKALPAPDETRPDAAGEYVAPVTPVEEALAGIWREVLGLERVGTRDNFFELGGHSLLATRVVSRINQLFGVGLPLRLLFEAPTVAALAPHVAPGPGSGPGLLPPPLRRRQDGCGPAPLSYAQQRLWFLHQLEPGSAAYNVPVALRLAGALDVAALERTLNEVVRRHEALRTSIVGGDGQPVQLINDAAALTLPVEDLSDLPAEQGFAAARRMAEQEARLPFDLTAAPLVRARLLRLAEDEHVLLFTLHHIVSDGWSMGVLVREIVALYEAFSRGRPSPLAELPIQYADYAIWQRDWLQGEVLEKQMAYWRRQLGGTLPVLELPTDYQRPAVQTHAGSTCDVKLEQELTAQLSELGRSRGATLYMVLLAAFQTLLSRYTGQTDIAVGSPIANRTRAELEGLIGFFVNTLVMRTDLSGEPSFEDVLGRVREVTLGAYAHQEVPFEKLVEELQPERSLSHTPLFQAMLVLQNTPREGLKLSELEVAPFGAGGSQTAKFDLMLTLVEGEHGLSGSLQYSSDLFKSETVERMVGHFQTLLAAVVVNPRQRLSELRMLGGAEEHRLLVGWNETARAYPTDVCLHELFERQAERTPDNVAVVHEDERLTYRELNERANRLAHHLMTLGVGPESLVGVCLERSAGMVVGLLAVLKAGAAYLPLDPAYPRERLAFMVEDSGLRVLLTHSSLLSTVPAGAARVVCLDGELEGVAGGPGVNTRARVGANNLAYVIYTSGSTGKPKGAMLEHRGVVNCVSWMQETYRLDASDRFLLKTSLNFDPSVWELFWTLSVGATVVVAESGRQADVSHLVGLMAAHQVTTVYFVPTLLRAFVEAEGVERLTHLRRVICGGEALTGETLGRFAERVRAELHHSYGPTETSIAATEWPCQVGEEIRMGRPLGNVQLYVLDRWRQLAPTGVVGELYIGGDGVGRGYLNRPELTAERFVPDSFGGRAGARLYRTGDLVRYRDGGQIEFIGRVDEQVKVRGYRIEPGEIEAALAAHEDVREAVVVVREETGGHKRLVAYVVGEDGGARDGLSVTGLRGHLGERLPEYMVPSAFVVLGELPLMPNGKVDRKALPAPEQGRGGLDGALVTPRDVLELRLARMWEELLGVRPVGVTDNFFELGGHSLLAVRLISSIRQQLGVTLPLSSLFQATTVERLAGLLRGRLTRESHSPLVALKHTGSNRPFFCVHPAGGNVFCYVELANHLDADQPFYAFQAQGLEGGARYMSVEELAGLYVASLRESQPEGPYLLGGWSLGGVLAYEMARQLEAQGQRVDLLALLDSVVPVHDVRAGEADEVELLLSFAAHLGLSRQHLAVPAEQLSELTQDEGLTRLMNQAKAAGVLPSDLGPEQVLDLYGLFKNNVRALAEYVPRPYAGGVTLIRADGRPVARGHDGDPTEGWGALAAGGVELYGVPGNHFSIVRRPHVAALAGQLETCIRQATGL